MKESLPDRSGNLADIRDKLSNKLGLKNALEFLCKYGYDGNDLRGSYLFVLCTSPYNQQKGIKLK